ncbi:uncharacterized protein I303_106490 [Kwoniella dejecticola CBS 10117]|uniref:Aldehyde dehydrogenase domain-containing protein n=1 Tax=Kwoniella dejecticola CBS 10117 TaxID=1296121 RepID=A0A1A5ZUJ6_9TREE|nr:uncharacterized protein I303_08252 [Kwoniella dejecticola CBS 10117]OBR81482.1 hypothetical protein I303_08252 [Kwoniella dejecticola CBS 10117]
MSQIETRLWINNEYAAPHNGETFPIYNAFDGSLVADVAVAGPEDVEAAVQGAEVGQKVWFDLSGVERATVMRRFANLLRDATKDLARLDGLTMGRPVHTNDEGTRSAATWEYYAGLAEHVHGTSSLLCPGYVNINLRQPFGVTCGIIPWNLPVGAFAFKAAPAVAAGNAIIIKTSEKAPLAIAHLSKLIAQAGFPPGVIQILHGAGKTGALLSEHMKIRKLSFTGSTNTGRAILRASADSNLKNVTLELGGKSPTIVFEDADLDQAIKDCAFSISFNSGQVCIASSRLYVHAGVYDSFVQGLVEAFKGVEHGNPQSESTTMGPQADKAQSSIVSNYIEVGLKEGKVVYGGKADGDDNVNAFKPTIITDLPDSSAVNTEEVFGPVLVIHKFTDEQEVEVLKRCNDSPYGLYSAVYTKNFDRAMRVAKALEAGSVGVNCNSPFTANDLPFGGWKASGIGRENGPNGLDPWLEYKSIYMRVAGL